MKLFSILFIFTFLIVVNYANSAVNNLDLPLYDPENIEYLGTFNLPSGGGTIGGYYHDGFRYVRQGSGAIAYNPANNSLIIGGGDLANDGGSTVIAEVNIPTPRKSEPYNTAEIIQDFVIGVGTKGRQWDAVPEGGNGASLTGMLISNGRLLMTVAGLYTSNIQPTCMFVRSSLDFSSSSVSGPYKVTNLAQQRVVGNGMGCNLPENWQSTFGGYKAIVGGGGNLSTMNTGCYGPGFHFFNPDDVGTVSGTVPGGNACYYYGIGDKGSGFPFGGDETDVWNGMSIHRGSVVLPESRTFMAFGPGGGHSFYDFNGATCGGTQHSVQGGNMKDRFWLYDARDLKDAFDGNTSAVNNIYPYATYDMNFSRNSDGTCFGEGEVLRSLTFDPANRKAYIFECSHRIIHVLKFNGDSPSSAQNAQRSGASAALEAFPNPFTREISISLVDIGHKADGKGKNIRIYDTQGRLVYTEPFTANRKPSNRAHAAYRWDAGDQPPGVYLIKAEMDNKTLLKRVTLVR
jgi:hypothetical protein